MSTSSRAGATSSHAIPCRRIAGNSFGFSFATAGEKSHLGIWSSSLLDRQTISPSPSPLSAAQPLPCSGWARRAPPLRPLRCFLAGCPRFAGARLYPWYGLVGGCACAAGAALSVGDGGRWQRQRGARPRRLIVLTHSSADPVPTRLEDSPPHPRTLPHSPPAGCTRAFGRRAEELLLLLPSRQARA